MKNLLFFWVLTFCTSAVAYETIEIIVPNPPGGTTDIIARHLAPVLASKTGKSVIVINRPGAFGKIAVDHLAKNSARTPSVLLMSTGTFYQLVVNKDRELDSMTIAAPIMTAESVLAVHVVNAIPTWTEFLAWTRRQPVTCGVSNAAADAAARYIKQRLDLTNLEILAFKGSAEVNQALAGNHIQCAFDTEQTLRPLLQDNRVKYLATMAAKESTRFNDLPSIAQTIPGFEFINWYGLAVHESSTPDFKSAMASMLPTLGRDITTLPDLRPVPRTKSDWVKDQSAKIRAQTQ